MSTRDEPPPGVDPGSPLHARYPGANRPGDVPVDEAMWSRVHDGQQVLSSTGEHLGRVREKTAYVFEVEVRQGLLTTRELYVPHMAVDRVEGDTVHLAVAKQELVESYEHYRRYHFGHPAGA